MLTEEEKALILKLLNDVKIAPLDANAIQVVTAIQTLAKKIISLSAVEKKASDFSDSY